LNRVWRHPFVWTAFLLFITAACTSETDSPATTSQLEQHIQAQLDAIHQTANTAGKLFPGATLAIGMPDGRLLNFATGYDDIEQKLPMTPGARMPAGSIGKTFVAAVVLRMVEEGTLQLDDRVERWLGTNPWFHHLPNGESMTVRHLLNHSSGLIDHIFDKDSRFAGDIRSAFTANPATVSFNPKTFVQYALDREPLFPAGEGFHYSETGYLLLGMIIERASGSSYYDELTRRLIEPLNLTLTSAQNQRKFTGLAAGYAPQGRELFNLPHKVAEADEFSFDPSLEWTGGGVVSNSQDLVRWAQALFEARVISNESLKVMLTSIARPETARDAAGRMFGYGLGINIARTKHGTAYRHGGFFPGYNSMLAYYPDHHIAIAMQINADDTDIEAHFEAVTATLMNAVAARGTN